MQYLLGIPETSFNGLRTRPARRAFILPASKFKFNCGRLMMLNKKMWSSNTIRIYSQQPGPC